MERQSTQKAQPHDAASTHASAGSVSQKQIGHVTAARGCAQVAAEEEEWVAEALVEIEAPEAEALAEAEALEEPGVAAEAAAVPAAARRLSRRSRVSRLDLARSSSSSSDAHRSITAGRFEDAMEIEKETRGLRVGRAAPDKLLFFSCVNSCSSERQSRANVSCELLR